MTFQIINTTTKQPINLAEFDSKYCTITGSSTLIQVFQLYQNKIKEKEHKNWKFNAAKYRNIAVANRKSHNYAVNQLIKESGLEYTPEIFKLMSLVINEKFSIRKMSIVKVDIALFKLANNVSI